jgi:hypothetical protein
MNPMWMLEQLREMLIVAINSVLYKEETEQSFAQTRIRAVFGALTQASETKDAWGICRAFSVYTYNISTGLPESTSRYRHDEFGDMSLDVARLSRLRRDELPSSSDVFGRLDGLAEAMQQDNLVYFDNIAPFVSPVPFSAIHFPTTLRHQLG